MHNLIINPDVVMQYDGLIFDMDGTLINTMPAHEQAWKQVGKEFGYHFDLNLMYELTGSTTYRIAEAMMQQANVPQDKLESIVQRKRELGLINIKQSAVLLPTFDIVRYFYGIRPMALGTGAHRKMVTALFEQFQIAHYFVCTITSNDVTKHKPHPETFLRCAQKINTLPSRCLVFEDGDLGIQAALAGKMAVFDVRDQQLHLPTL